MKLSLPEQLVWSAAFALELRAHEGAEYTLQIPRAVHAAWRAIDALRAATQVCEVANAKYVDEQRAYNKIIERRLVGEKIEPLRLTSAETQPGPLMMLRAFVNGGGA